MLKKLSIIFGSIIVVLVIIIGGITMAIKTKQHNQKSEMVKIVESEEAKKAYIRTINNTDPKAFTKDGVIQSYKVDYRSIEHNPMGGIELTLTINDDKEMRVYISLQKDTEYLRNAGGGMSVKLLDALRKKGLTND